MATPDLPDEVVARLFHETYERLAPNFGYRTREASAKPWDDVPEQNRALMIATVGEVLDAMRPDEATVLHNPDAICPEHFPDRPWLTCRARLDHEGPHMWLPERPSSPPPTPPPSGRRTPAPAGLSAAQEIRLRLTETLVEIPMAVDIPSMLAPLLSPLAAWVEHGDDETPDLREQARAERLDGWLQQAQDDLEHAEARAGLAEAQLGHIADALRDRGPDNGTTHEVLRHVADALAWTPDDTATAGYATGGIVHGSTMVWVPAGTVIHAAGCAAIDYPELTCACAVTPAGADTTGDE